MLGRLGFRHCQVLMLCIGMIIMFSIQTSMSIAIVTMTDISHSNSFNWSNQVQSVIHSSYQWGFFILKIPGGELATRFGGWLVLNTAVAVNAVVCLLIPTAAYWGGYQAICAFRFVQGLSAGVLYPLLHYLIANWAPLQEKSRIGAAIYASSQLGVALQMLCGGSISSRFGWPAIFYGTGAIALAWVILYLRFGASTPQQSKYISDEERAYVLKSLGQVGERKRIATPWRSLATSVPLYALIVASIGHGWVYWTLVTEIPTYMKHVMGFDTKQNGVVSSLPYFSSFVTSFIFSSIADHLITNSKINTTTCRKTFSVIGSVVPMSFLLALALTSSDVKRAIVFLTIGNAFDSAYFSGVNLVHLDMSPRHAPTLKGITATFGSIAGAMAPQAVGLIVHDQTSPLEWRNVFFLSCGVSVACNSFYLLFGTSQRQKWDETGDKSQQ